MIVSCPANNPRMNSTVDLVLMTNTSAAPAGRKVSQRRTNSRAVRGDTYSLCVSIHPVAPVISHANPRTPMQMEKVSKWSATRINMYCLGNAAECNVFTSCAFKNDSVGPFATHSTPTSSITSCNIAHVSQSSQVISATPEPIQTDLVYEKLIPNSFEAGHLSLQSIFPRILQPRWQDSISKTVTEVSREIRLAVWANGTIHKITKGCAQVARASLMAQILR